jgi:hypothetical protein
MARRAALVSLVVLTGALCLPDFSASGITAAGLPCEAAVPRSRSAPGPVPVAPSGLRILSRLLEPLRSAALTASGGANLFYESLASRPDCFVAYPLRDQAELDAYPTVNKGNPKKRPILYDPVQDAARIEIYAPVSTDIQGKYLHTSIDRTFSSWLLTFDFRFDEGFRWRPERALISGVEKGYMIRHKTWRLLPEGEEGQWLMIRTDYQHAASVGEFIELFVSMPTKRFLGPDAWIGPPSWYGEMLQPRIGEFFLAPSTWTRIWLYVEDFDKPVCYLSVWAADHQRTVQLLNRVSLTPPQLALHKFQIEYDTSGDFAINPEMAQSWNRNVVLLKNPSRTAVLQLLQRPGL